jgi:hypothetical protein
MVKSEAPKSNGPPGNAGAVKYPLTPLNKTLLYPVGVANTIESTLFFAFASKHNIKLLLIIR